MASNESGGAKAGRKEIDLRQEKKTEEINKTGDSNV